MTTRIKLSCGHVLVDKVDGVPLDEYLRGEEVKEKTTLARQLRQGEMSRMNTLKRPVRRHQHYESPGESSGFVKYFTPGEIRAEQERSEGMNNKIVTIVRKGKEVVDAYGTLIQALFDWNGNFVRDRLFDMKVTSDKNHAPLTSPFLSLYLISLADGDETIEKRFQLQSVSSMVVTLYRALSKEDLIERKKMGGKGKSFIYTLRRSFYRKSFQEVRDMINKEMRDKARARKDYLEKEEEPPSEDEMDVVNPLRVQILESMKEDETHQYKDDEYKIVEVMPDGLLNKLTSFQNNGAESLQSLRDCLTKLMEMDVCFGVIHDQDAFTDVYTLRAEEITPRVYDILKLWGDQLKGDKLSVEAVHEAVHDPRNLTDDMVRLMRELPRESTLEKTFPDGTSFKVKRL